MRWMNSEITNFNAFKTHAEIKEKSIMTVNEMKSSNETMHMKQKWTAFQNKLDAARRHPNQQLWMLFLSGNIILFVGMGLFPLLPLLDASLGASRASIGLHYAIMYTAYGLGPITASRFAGRLNRRTLFILGAAVGFSALVLLTHAASFWQVVVLTSLVWFAGGLNNALVSILTGVYASGNLRGRWFSLMSISVPLGSLIGGWTAGRLISANGYGSLFTVQALVWTGLLIVGLVGLVNPDAGKAVRQVRTAANSSSGWQSRAFVPLLVLALFSGIAINATRLGSSLSMQALRFTASMIASTTTISGLVAIPLTLLVGLLADRYDRKKMLVVTIIATAVGALILTSATQLWQFMVAATLVLVGFCTNRALTSAVAADLLDKTWLDQGMGILNATGAASSVISFASAGIIIDAIGMAGFFVLTALLAVTSLSTLMAQRKSQAAEPCLSCPNPA